MARIGLVTGLRFEADTLMARARDAGVSDMVDIRASGPGQARAYETARALVLDGAGLLISMGLAGGLHVALKAGDVVLANYVLGPDGVRHLTADGQRRFLMCQFKDKGSDSLHDLPVHDGPLASSADPVLTPSAKKALHLSTGALAVDMESHGVALAAYEADIPFLVMRVISDTQQQGISGTALAGMKADGTVSPWLVIKALLKNPGDFPGLLTLGRQSSIARKSLSRLGEGLFSCLF